MSHSKVSVRGVELFCDFTYFRAYVATQEQPGEPEMVEVSFCSTAANGVDITSLISEDCMAEIESQLIQNVYDEREAQECARADAMRDDHKSGMEAWIAAGHTTD